MFTVSLNTVIIGLGIVVFAISSGYFFGKHKISARGAFPFMIGSTSLVAMLNSAYSIWQYAHYKSSAWDLGIFDQAIWHLSNFQLPASSVRGVTNLFGDHFHPIISTLAPFYWLFHSPVILLVAQGILFASIIPAAYFLARHLEIAAWPAVVLALAFGINPGLTPALGFDFHEIAFAAPLLIMAFLFFEKKRWGGYSATIALLLLTKESMAIYVAVIGVVLLLKKSWRAGLATLAAGIIWYFAVTRLIIPILSDTHTYNYWDQYAHLAPNAQSFPLKMIEHPWTFVHELYNNPIKVMSNKLIVGSFGVLVPLFSLTTLPLIAVALAEKFWPNNIDMWVYDFQYQILIVAVFSIATLYSLRNLQRWFPKIKTVFTPAIAIFVLCLTVWVSTTTESVRILWNHEVTSRPIKEWNEVMRSIPTNASVSASNAFVPHLSERETIYRFPKIRNAQWIVLDSVAPSFPYTAAQITDEQRNFTNDPIWTLVRQTGTLTIFHRDSTTWISDRADDPATLH